MKKVLEKAKELFQQCYEADNHNKEAMIDDLKFVRNSEQWEEIVKTRRLAKGKPVLTINRIASAVKNVVNDARQNRPQINVIPVDDVADIKTAKVISGIIKYIENYSNAYYAYDRAIEDAVSCGTGYIRVILEESPTNPFEVEIKIKEVVDPVNVYIDPYSTAIDGSDMEYAFIVSSMSKRQLENKYGDKLSDWDDYKSLPYPWLKDDSVMLCEFWIREHKIKKFYLLNTGEVITEDLLNILPVEVEIIEEKESKIPTVKQYILTGVDVLEENEFPSKYIPIIPVYGELFYINGKRYTKSLVRDAKDAQRMFNYWRTTTTELVALSPKAPFIGKRGTFNSDFEKWIRINEENFPFVEYDGDAPPTRVPFPAPPAGALQEAMNSLDDIRAITGTMENFFSDFKAGSSKVLALKERLMNLSSFHFIDNLSYSIRHVGKILVDLIPKIYNKMKVIRILGEDDKPRTVTVNAPVIENGIEKIYDLTVGQYDVTVIVGPSYATRRQEAANQLLELAKINPDAFPVMGDIIAKALDVQGAQELAERLRKLLPPQLQEVSEEDEPNKLQEIHAKYQQAIQQLQQQLIDERQKVMQAQADLKNKEAEKIIETQKLQIEAYKAQTERMTKEAEIMKSLNEIRDMLYARLAQ